MNSVHSTATTARRLATRHLPLVTLFLLSLLIGLYAAQPLLSRRIAEGADTLLHYFRLAQVAALWDQGILFSRWSPDLAYGYGYPLFNYYAPLSYYVAEFLHLASLALPAAFVGTFVLIFLGASAAAFLWARDVVGAPVAIVSAAAFALSPYLMINLLHRGALAESMALALMPLIFWLAYRAVIDRQWYFRLATVLFFAALILTHNISALILTPILAAYILLLDFSYSARDDHSSLSLRSAILSDLWLLVLAIVVTAWYWLPALGEQNLVQISQTFGPDHFRYENNFLSLRELLAGPFFLDVRLANQAFPLALNLLALALGIIGVATYRNPSLRRIDRLHILFAATATLIFCIMMFSVSAPIWETLPLLKYLQFPWRFLGIATLFLAILAGYGIRQLHAWTKGRSGASALITTAAVLGMALYIIPWTFAEYYEPIQSESMADSVAYEVESGYLGTTSAGEYLPVRVRQLPDTAQILDAKRKDKLAAGSLPAGATILESHFAPLSYRVVADSPEPYTALFNTFFFEGWRATLDGIETPIVPADSSGLISLDVPPGKHTLEITFNSTLLRRVAVGISLGGLGLVAGTLILGRSVMRRRRRERPPLARLSWVMPLFVMGALLAGVVARDYYLETVAPASSRYDGSLIAGVDVPLELNFDNRLALIGLDSPAEIASDDVLELTLYWRATMPNEENHSASVVVLDAAGNVIGQSDHQHIGQIPTSRWPMNKYAADDHRITFLLGTPPGAYSIAAAVYKYGRPGERLDILDELGNPTGQSVRIGQITIGRPDRPASVATLDLAGEIDVPVVAGVRLVGFEAPQDSVWAGGNVGFDLYWQADEDPAADLTTGLWLRDAGGDSISAGRIPLVADFPTSLWKEGDLWLGKHHIVVPPTLAAGAYTLALGEDEQSAVEILPLSVNVPEHTMEAPPFAYEQDARFGDVARLVGYDAPASAAAASSLSVTLHWQSLGQTSGSYRSFVQLLDQDGRLVAGSDQVPAGWQRPTTSWIEGEYIADTHKLSVPAGLPPGPYRLSAGLYDAASSQRLRTLAGLDSAIFETPLAITED
jgi:hypothetical protein